MKGSPSHEGEPRVVERRIRHVTPWFQVVEKHLQPGGATSPHYLLHLQDYVTCVALTRKEELLLVRQYRPVLERESVELPGGTLEPGETPQACMARELREETGYRPVELVLMGQACSDTGRLENTLWSFFAWVEPDPDPLPRPPGEDTLASFTVPLAEVFAHWLPENRIDNGLCGLPLLLALVQKRLPWQLVPVPGACGHMPPRPAAERECADIAERAAPGL